MAALLLLRHHGPRSGQKRIIILRPSGVAAAELLIWRHIISQPTWKVLCWSRRERTGHVMTVVSRRSHLRVLIWRYKGTCIWKCWKPGRARGGIWISRKGDIRPRRLWMTHLVAAYVWPELEGRCLRRRMWVGGRGVIGTFSRRFSGGAPEASEQMSLIRQLRERTCAPIKDVKASLVDCNWDMEAAQTDLRKRGKVLASKKSSRTATEGLLALAQSESNVAVIELNCETDFVARNEIFQHLALCLALCLAKQALLLGNSSSGVFPLGLENLEDLKLNLEHPKISGETTVQNAITEVAAMMGENVKLRRGYAISTSAPGVLSTYLHTSPQPGLGRMAGILSLEVEDVNCQLDALRRLGPELAMHVVAAKPLFLTKKLVSTEAFEKEREILKSQAETSGRPAAAIEKMVEGRLRKYYEDVVLMEQKFIVNDSVNVKTLLNNLSKEVGSPVKIGSFFRMEVGEGVQRIEASDASEPVAQAA